MLVIISINDSANNIIITKIIGYFNKIIEKHKLIIALVVFL